eukprot:531-Chlamydomonas_euryale.AAC.1
MGCVGSTGWDVWDRQDGMCGIDRMGCAGSTGWDVREDARGAHRVFGDGMCGKTLEARIGFLGMGCAGRSSRRVWNFGGGCAGRSSRGALGFGGWDVREAV